MDKNAIKKYAVWARKELIARVTQKAEQYELRRRRLLLRVRIALAAGCLLQ